ncbi:MAG: inner rane transporter RhtA [Solirubrobacteraceae bacterium]|jgi:inner membrane transporter RhtA|nr:inner rane transporter RhtA [Solirubrobacteraceae bacterium]
MLRAAPATATTQRLPPQALFVLGAISQYVGAALAVLLFASVPAAGVAWLRVVSSAAVLLAWRRPWRTRWTAGRLRLVTAFGVTLAAMNVTFYLAIDRLPLGTAVAIEFCGPIAVAALGSRTRSDAGALALAIAGVLALADVHLAGSPDGLAFAVAAGVAWAGYIVLGHRIAADAAIRPQDGLALGMAIGAAGFAPILVSSAVPALVSAPLLAACLAVGVASSVVPYALEQIAMRRLPRARFALLLALLPATAAIVGALILGQVPGLVEGAGIGLVVVASLLRSHDSL